MHKSATALPEMHRREVIYTWMTSLAQTYYHIETKKAAKAPFTQEGKSRDGDEPTGDKILDVSKRIGNSGWGTGQPRRS